MAVGCLPLQADPPPNSGRIRLDQPGDLPAHAYVIKAKSSDEAQDFGAVLLLAMQVEKDLKDDVVARRDDLLDAPRTDSAAGKVTRTPLGTILIPASGAYFGQPLPGVTPVLFAPEVLQAVSPWVSGIAFSPDGTECFLHVGDASYSRANMYYSRCVNGAWTPLVEPSFLANFTFSCEPVYSKDGNTLTFTAKKGAGSTDLWLVGRTASGWGIPVVMPAPVNSDMNEFRGSYAADGTFFFGSERAASGINQGFKATRNASSAWVVEKLGAPVNALSYDGDPCIAPDGRFLVTYAGRAGGFGRVDLYVSFSDGKGGWGKPVNLGPTFNTADDEFGACLSHDGKYLFFTRHTAGGDRLFWVSVSAIDRLKP
jgi:hypothetical protein